MPAPTSTNELVELIYKSQIVDRNRLALYLDGLRSASALPEEPGRLAGLLVHDGLLTHFLAEQFMHGRWRGFIVCEYKILERLGQGRTAAVYLCEDVNTSKRYAMKVLPRSRLAGLGSESVALLKRYYDEMAAAGAFDHPYIARVQKVSEEGELAFVIMEFIDGPNLRQLTEQAGPLPITQACEYLRQTLMGLQHVLAKCALHRAIEATDLMVNADGSVVKMLDRILVKLLDRGLATLLKTRQETTYKSSEEAFGSENIDINSDLYDLGCIFYFLLTGQKANSGMSSLIKPYKRWSEDPNPVEQLRPEIPGEVATTVRRLLTKDCGERYKSLAQLEDALLPFCKDDDLANWIRPGRRQLSPLAMVEPLLP
jgi:serine/threonine protein kinase